MKVLFRAAFLVAFFIFAFLSFGKNSIFSPLLLASDLSSSVALPEIEVRAKNENTSSEKPSAFVTSVDLKPFENQVKSLPEILSEQSGVNVHQYGGLGQFSTISIRGSSAEQVSVLIDGMKINTAQGGAVDFSSIPLDAIDHVEILRGGASAQYGSDAIGGVINILTKKAKKGQSVEFSFGGGSFGTFKSAFGYSNRKDRWSLVFNHSHLQSEGNYSFLTTPTQIAGSTVGGGQKFTRENNQFFSENGLLKFDVQPNEKLRIKFLTDWTGGKRQVAPTEDEQILLSPKNLPEASESLLKNISSVSVEMHSLGLQNLHLELQPYYRYDLSHFTDPSPGLGGAIDVKYRNQSVGGKMKWSYALDSNSAPQKLQLQYEYRYDHFKDENRIVPTAISGKRTRSTHSLFASDEISLFHDKLNFYPSVRYEHTSDFGSEFALHLGVKAQPFSWMGIKANVENSYRYPNFNELFLPNQGIIRGNPNLDPEKALNVDAGFQFQHRYGHHEVSYFYNRVKNSIIFVPISAFTIAPINTRRLNLQGLEISSVLDSWKHLSVEGN
ncbi:MAG: TonB-dependent receptor [Deltaproteobacteria bacterium]|nr:TonB-dependent receptor [Deltaproteobacteria bacterium]